MGYGILIWIAAAVAQPPEQAGKGAVPEAKAAARSAASEEASVVHEGCAVALAERAVRRGRGNAQDDSRTKPRSRRRV